MFIQIMALLLWFAMIGQPISGPGLVPPVTTPALPPINVIPPVRSLPIVVPATEQPATRVPRDVMKALRGISNDAALEILSRDVDIVWEPARP